MAAQQNVQRRHFLKASGILGAGLLLPNLSMANGTFPLADGNIHQFGKREGFTEQISILVSMMDWMRMIIMRDANGLSQKEVDFLLDDNSNTIGAMLMHLAATERFYQLDTFSGIPKSKLNFGVEESIWNAASNLGDAGRKTFVDKPLSFYLDKLGEVREFSKKN